MSDPKATTIDAKIVSLLEGIDGSGDYQNELKNVYDYFVAPQVEGKKPEALPYACFGAYEEDSEALDVNNTLTQVDAAQLLWIWAKYTGIASARAAIRSLHSDLKIALEDDFTLGNLVMDSAVGKVVIGEITPNSGHVSAHVRFSYRYTHTAGDPTT